MPEAWKVTQLVSADSRGTAGTTFSLDPHFSGDGNSIFFVSQNSLVAADTDQNWDFYKKDLVSGAISLVLVDGQGVLANGQAGGIVGFTANQRELIFSDSSTNLVPSFGNGMSQLYAKDMITGGVRPLSIDAQGKPAANGTGYAQISGDGAWLAYTASGVNSLYELVVENLATKTVVRVGNDVLNGFNKYDVRPVAFTTDDHYLLFAARPTTPDNDAYFLFDTTTGTASRFLIDAANLQRSDLHFQSTATTHDSTVIFGSGKKLLPTTGSYGDLYLRDLVTGTISMVRDGKPSLLNGLGFAGTAAFSPDGTKLAFTGGGILPSDDNDASVFVRDMRTGQITPVYAPDGVHGLRDVTGLTWSSDSTKLAFVSYQQLLPGDKNDRSDIYVAQLEPTTQQSPAGAFITLSGLLQSGTYGDDRFVSDPWFRTTVLEAGVVRAQASITRQGDELFVVDSPNGHDTLVGISRLRFDDGVLILDSNPGDAAPYRLYRAALGRLPDEYGFRDQTDRLYRDVYLGSTQHDALVAMARDFMRTAEFVAKYGSAINDASFVDLLYHNVLGRAADAAGAQTQINALQGGLERAAMLLNFSESAENIAATSMNTTIGLWITAPRPEYF